MRRRSGGLGILDVYLSDNLRFPSSWADTCRSDMIRWKWTEEKILSEYNKVVSSFSLKSPESGQSFHSVSL